MLTNTYHIDKITQNRVPTSYQKERTTDNTIKYPSQTRGSRNNFLKCGSSVEVNKNLRVEKDGHTLCTATVPKCSESDRCTDVLALLREFVFLTRREACMWIGCSYQTADSGEVSLN